MTAKQVFNQIPTVLAVLVAENRAYTYIDKLSYAPTKDLALLYLREALRDFHSLLNQGRWENPRAREAASGIKWEYVELELKDIEAAESLVDLREKLSLIATLALSRAAGLTRVKDEEKEGEKGR